MHSIEISIAGKEILNIFGFSLTNTFILSVLAAWGLIFIFFISFGAKRIIPRWHQNFLEFILETFYNFTSSITGDEKKTKEIFPIAATLFVLILASNLFELIPGVGVFHFLRSPSSDLNFTIALALFSVTYINYSAIRKLGPFSYLKKFLNFKSPVLLFVGLLEGISELNRILSLSFRLFGNLFAGEVLLIVTSFLFAFILPLPFLLLEILVGLIQALIFASLTVIFYVNATQTEHG